MNHDTWFERTTQHLMNEEDRQLIRVFTELAWNESRRNMWISVEERLPEVDPAYNNYVPVLFKSALSSGLRHGYARYEHHCNEWWDYQDGDTLPVLYWAPLPGYQE